MTALISTDPGAELIGYAAVLFAQNFDLVQAAAMDQLELPLPEGTMKGKEGKSNTQGDLTDTPLRLDLGKAVPLLAHPR